MKRFPSSVALFAYTATILAGCGFTQLEPSPTFPPLIQPATLSPDAPTQATLADPSTQPTSIPPAEPSFESGFATIEYTLPITIRHVMEDRVLLFFELAQPSAGVLVVRNSGELVSVIDLPPGETRHPIEVDGLQPNTQYTLEVGLTNEQGSYNVPAFRGQAWGPVTVHTQSPNLPIRMVVIGDAGMGDAITPQLAAQMVEAQPDAVIFTGDTVYNIRDNRDHYEAFALKYYLPFAPLLQSMPIYTTVGNHDVEAATIYEGEPFYYHAFPPFADPRIGPSDYAGNREWVAAAYGKFQFLFLDTQTFYGDPGNVEQIEFIKQRLADGQFAFTIPAFHIPPYTSGDHTFDGLPVRDQWQPLFEGSRVPLVLSGHDHNYERLIINGITYLVSGGGSGSLYNQQTTIPESEFFAAQNHFVILDFYEDRIELQSVAFGGEILDVATISLPQ